MRGYPIRGVANGRSGQFAGSQGLWSGRDGLVNTLNWGSASGFLVPPGFSLIRASTGRYYDSAGLLQTAAVDEARGTYRWNGSSWVFDGTIVEAAATNVLKRSNNLSHASWLAVNTGSTTQNATGLDGATSAWTLTDSDAANLYYKVLNAGVTLTAASYTLSFYVGKTVGAQASYPVMWAYDTVATTLALVTIDTTNGVATAWTAYTGLPLASGISARCESISATRWRVSLTWTASANSWWFDLAPACTANPTKSTGTVNDEPTLTGSAVFERGQLELGTAATSYIDNNTDTSTARSADVLTAPTSGLLVNAQGFAAIKARVIAGDFGNQTDWVSGFTAAGEGIPIYRTSTGAGGNLRLYDGATERDFGAVITPTVGSVVSLATTWGGASCNGAVNGAVGTAQAFDGNMNLGSTLQIAADAAVAGISLVLQSIRLGTVPASAARLANLTA